MNLDRLGSEKFFVGQIGKLIDFESECWGTSFIVLHDKISIASEDSEALSFFVNRGIFWKEKKKEKKKEEETRFKKIALARNPQKQQMKQPYFCRAQFPHLAKNWENSGSEKAEAKRTNETVSSA